MRVGLVRLGISGILGLGLGTIGCGGNGERRNCPDEEGPGWVTLVDDTDGDGDDLEASILSVWGPSIDDLYFAGGTMRPVEPAFSVALHYDGESWERLPIDIPQSFWWTTVTPEGTAWFAGEEGAIVRWRDREATVFDPIVDATLYGIWGTSDTNVWSVGGDAQPEGEKDVILHFDGTEWTRVPPPEEFGAQLFKVWGTGEDDIFIVGGRGVILHYDGEAWSPMDSGTTAQLFTVHGRSGTDVWAVGFESSATILHYDGSTWEPYVDPCGAEVFASFMNGVYAPVGGDVFCVGPNGVKIRILDDGTHVEETLQGTGADLHGVWANAQGRAFAVGGNFFSPDPPTRDGAIGYRGEASEVPTEGLPENTAPY